MSSVLHTFGPILYQNVIDAKKCDELLSICKEASEDYRWASPAKIHKLRLIDNKEHIQVINMTILPYIRDYVNKLISRYRINMVEDSYELMFSNPWVNFQIANEYNSLHDHNGNIGYVIYADIPEQIAKEPHTARHEPSGSITYVYGEKNNNSSLGEIEQILNPITFHNFLPRTGDMFLFPSYLRHHVQSFHTPDVERISIAGNITLKGINNE